MKNIVTLFCGLLLSLGLQAAPQVLALDWKDSARGRTLPLKVRVPEGNAPVPLVIFSHGLGGSREGGKAWGEHWSANGYLVIHVQHPGSDESLWRANEEGTPRRRLMRGATAEQFLRRVEDVRFVLDELTQQAGQAKAPAWVRRADLSRVAMTGHSFGALTTMALANEQYPGPIKSVADPRISAFIAFSPSVQGAEPTWPQRFGAMNKAFLTLTGTLDGDVLGTGTGTQNRALLFDLQPPGDKYRVVFQDGDHAVFNGGNLREADWMNWVTGQRNESTPPAAAKIIHEQVKKISLAYLDAYLKKDATAKQWLNTEAAKALGDAGTWSAK